MDPDACGPAASAEDLFRESAAKHFPSPPPEGDGALSPERLDQHLSSGVQLAVSGELRRLRPLLRGELGGVARAYHRHAMQHVLLPQVTATSQLALVLMKWLCNVYFRCACVHTYMIHTHTHTHTYIHTCTHTHTHTHTHAHTYCTYIHTYIHTYMHTHTHTCTHILYIHTYIHTHTHTYMKKTTGSRAVSSS